MNIYWQIFYTFFLIGLFNFGGGYPMIALIQNEVVMRHAWLTNTQFADVVAISQMTPGPVGINMATYSGFMAGHTVWGAVLATLAVCVPSFLVMIFLAKYFLKHRDNPSVQAVFKGLRLAVIGLIAAAALVLCDGGTFVGVSSLFFFGISFVLLLRFDIHPVLLILLAGLGGWFVY